LNLRLKWDAASELTTWAELGRCSSLDTQGSAHYLHVERLLLPLVGPRLIRLVVFAQRRVELLPLSLLDSSSLAKSLVLLLPGEGRRLLLWCEVTSGASVHHAHRREAVWRAVALGVRLMHRCSCLGVHRVLALNFNDIICRCVESKAIHLSCSCRDTLAHHHWLSRLLEVPIIALVSNLRRFGLRSDLLFRLAVFSFRPVG